MKAAFGIRLVKNLMHPFSWMDMTNPHRLDMLPKICVSLFQSLWDNLRCIW